jgi:hypothetical protein
MPADAHHLPYRGVVARTSCHPRRLRTVGGAALLAALVASTGLGTLPAAAATTFSGLAPGTIFVANAGADGYGGSGGTGPGSITLYRPSAVGNARPEAVVTKGVDGPGSITANLSGDLWVANPSGTIVEYTRADLGRASPVPTVTLSYSPAIVSFDPSGDLWANTSSAIVEFTKSQLARSGTPKPKVTLSATSCTLALDAAGDLLGGQRLLAV